MLSAFDMQDQPPTLASLVGSLSLEGTSSMQTAARSALHGDEWLKLRPPPALHTSARPAWVPKPEKLDSLPQEALLEVAVPLDLRQAQASYTPLRLIAMYIHTFLHSYARMILT